jgi:ribose transport system substrate-binding protein
MRIFALSTAALMTALAGIATPTPAPAQSNDLPVIALSNSFYGNTWRRQMVDAFTEAAEKAKAEGKIADYVVLNGDGSVNQQSSQMAELILRGVDAIAINAASETALNSMAEKACDAGIAVVAFDSLLTAPCAYKLSFDFTDYKAKQARATLELIGNRGNVIVVRGVRGSGPDNLMYEAQMSVLNEMPDVNVVATVYGQATASVAQSAIANVLPSLPQVDAVLGQGGSDDYGIAQAFEQYGGPYAEKMPVIEGGGSSDFVLWWAEKARETGYKTTSMNTTPGIGGAAFWLAYEIVQGAEAPKELTMPVAVVDESNLQEFAEGLQPGFIISPSYDQQWVRENLLASTSQ